MYLDKLLECVSLTVYAHVYNFVKMLIYLDTHMKCTCFWVRGVCCGMLLQCVVAVCCCSVLQCDELTAAMHMFFGTHIYNVHAFRYAHFDKIKDMRTHTQTIHTHANKQRSRQHVRTDMHKSAHDIRVWGGYD